MAAFLLAAKVASLGDEKPRRILIDQAEMKQPADHLTVLGIKAGL